MSQDSKILSDSEESKVLITVTIPFGECITISKIVFKLPWSKLTQSL